MLNNEVLPQTSMNDAITQNIIVANSNENGEMEKAVSCKWMDEPVASLPSLSGIHHLQPQIHANFTQVMNAVDETRDRYMPAGCRGA